MEVTVAYGEPEVKLLTDIDFSINAEGPVVSFGKYKWHLFNLPIGLQVKLGNSVKLVYNDDKDKYVGCFGDLEEPAASNDTLPNGKLTPEAKKLKNKTWNVVKKFVRAIGKNTNGQMWNELQSLMKKDKTTMIVHGDKSLIGYVEFTRNSSGGYSLGVGEVCVLFTAGVKLEYKFPPAKVVYIKFSISGTLETGFKVKMVEAGNLDKGLELSGEISLDLKPSISMGTKIGKHVKVEGGLEGEIKGTVNLRASVEPTFLASRDLKATLKANLYLSYKAFTFINGKKTLPITDFTIYPKSESRMLNSSVASSHVDDMKLIPSDFADTPSYFMANNQLATNVLGNNTTNQIFKSNVYPYGEPQITEVGQDKYLMAWLDHNSDRHDENATTLYYSYYNGESWSSPTVVDDDGTCDFSPYIVGYENGAFLAWQNSESIYEEDVTLDDIIKSIGIKVAQFEDGVFNTYQITESDQMLDSSPILVIEENIPTVVWTINSENDLFGIEGYNTFYQSIFSDNGWSAPKEIHTEIGYIGEVSAALHDEMLYIAYSKDMNGDITDYADNEIMLIVGDNDPLQITNNDCMDANPKLVVRDGKVALYWYEDGIIKCMSDINQEEQREITISGYAGMSFDVISNGLDQLILWEEADGFSTNLKAI